MTLFYRTYGLTLRSDRPIPGLSESLELPLPSDIHVEVEFAAKPSWVHHALALPAATLFSIPACEETRDPAFTLTSFGEGRFFQLYYSDGSHFVVNGAATGIWGMPGESQTMDDLSPYFLGPVMGYVLRRRGITALHASAVCIDGNAVVLIGAAGAGKSTSAAALALRGAPVLCEDIAAVEELNGGFSIQPGYPRVCLWPESVEMLMGNSRALPRIAENWDKRYLALDGLRASLETHKRPLAAVYILAPRETENAPRLEDVSGRDVLLELVQNTYMNWLLDRRQRAEEFELLSRLVSHVPVRKLVPHRDPQQISALCDLIFADARRILPGKMQLAASAGH